MKTFLWIILAVFGNPGLLIWCLIVLMGGFPTLAVMQDGQVVFDFDSVIGGIVYLAIAFVLSLVGSGIHAVVFTGEDGFTWTPKNALLYLGYVILWGGSAMTLGHFLNSH